MPHYHIRWSGKAALDWEAFSTFVDANARAKQLVRLGESYTIEERDGECLRCEDAANVKYAHQ